jgi:hypothetical protein
MKGYIFLCLWLSATMLLGQKPEKKSFESTDSLYNANIKKSKLYGVYIPRDIDDALEKLMELTEEDARKKLLAISEEEAAKKLFFGLGRWMAYNWNFDEGSRFSHYLRQKGLIYTDDMVRCMIILFHRKISQKPLDEIRLIEELAEHRQQWIEEERKSRLKVVSEEVIEKKQN